MTQEITFSNHRNVSLAHRLRLMAVFQKYGGNNGNSIRLTLLPLPNDAADGTLASNPCVHLWAQLHPRSLIDSYGHQVCRILLNKLPHLSDT